MRSQRESRLLILNWLLLRKIISQGCVMGKEDGGGEASSDNFHKLLKKGKITQEKILEGPTLHDILLVFPLSTWIATLVTIYTYSKVSKWTTVGLSHYPFNYLEGFCFPIPPLTPSSRNNKEAFLSVWNYTLNFFFSGGDAIKTKQNTYRLGD